MSRPSDKAMIAAVLSARDRRVGRESRARAIAQAGAISELERDLWDAINLKAESTIDMAERLWAKGWRKVEPHG